MEERLKLYSQREAQELYKSGRRIFGAPMAMPHPKSRHYPQEDALKGIVGEHAVSGILNLLTFSYEDMYVFHSVGISDDEDGETDHIIIYKNRVFIVETKNYSMFSSIFVNSEGIASGRKTGQTVVINDNNIMKKVAFYQKIYPTMKVEAVLVITRPQIKTGSSFSKYSIVSIKELIELIQAKFAMTEDSLIETRNSLIRRFANLCIRNENFN